jgi:hypothetical protein
MLGTVARLAEPDYVQRPAVVLVMGLGLGTSAYLAGHRNQLSPSDGAAHGDMGLAHGSVVLESHDASLPDAMRRATAVKRRQKCGHSLTLSRQPCHNNAHYRTLPAIGMPSAQGYPQYGGDFHRWDCVISLDKS